MILTNHNYRQTSQPGSATAKSDQFVDCSTVAQFGAHCHNRTNQVDNEKVHLKKLLITMLSFLQHHIYKCDLSNHSGSGAGNNVSII